MAAVNREHRTYGKPFVVPERLDLLTGPTSGVVTLPPHLDWSGSAQYDLDKPGRIIDLYRIVINEATNPDDLYTYLEVSTLKRLWTYLWVPPQARQAWEEHFSELRQLTQLTK